MGNAGLAPLESSKQKAEPARVLPLKTNRPASIPGIPGFLSAAGNMAIQRAASGPLSANPAAASILGGANMSGGGCTCSTGACEECKKKPMQRKAEADMPAPSHNFHGVMGRSGSGAPLGPHTRTMMEDRFGQDFGDVRIHSGGAAAEAARSIHAHAFTTGRDIYFGQGRYEPHTVSGQKLLAHELTHVLQQRRGAVPPGLKSLNASAHDDVFEQEAEQVERHFDRHEHGAVFATAGTPKNGRDHSSRGRSGPIQRKCSCGGTCSECSSQGSQEAAADLKKGTLQRKANDLTLAAGAQRQNQTEDGSTHTSQESPIQRKCSCGGRCSKCSEEEAKAPPVQRKAETAEQVREKSNSGRQSHALNERRRRRETPRNERDAREHAVDGAQSRNRGNRVVRSGRRPAFPLQRAASTGGSNIPSITRTDKFEREANVAANHVARGQQVPAEKISEIGEQTIQPFDWEWCNPFTDPDCGIRSTAGVVAGEASEIADEVWDEAKALAEKVGGFLSYINNLLTITIPPKHVLGAHSFQLELPEVGVDIPFLAGAVPIAPGVEVYGEVGLHLGIIPEIGLQLGPFDTHVITIALHPLTLDGEVTGGFDLTIGGLLGGEARAGIFGEVGVIVEWPDPPLVLKVPVANIQAGLAGTVRGMLADKMSVDFHADAGITGFSFDTHQVHNLVAAVDVGLAGYGKLAVLGINLCTLKWPLYEAHADSDIRLALDFGVGSLLSGFSGLGSPFGGSGYSGGGGTSGGGGSSDSYGDSGFTGGGGGGFGGGGASGSFDDNMGAMISPHLPQASLEPANWDDLGVRFNRQMHKDDCPLCKFLYDLGLMPSQRGGSWKGHPKPAWPVGPLHGVFPRDPHITSKALCRGACGPDCDTCKQEKEHYECEQAGDKHIWWVYPRYEICGTHLGCRNHDACYDWCAHEHGETGKLGIILGPCHRLCDLECVCDYNLPQCVGWIGGKPPHDPQPMVFSDAPLKKDGCHTPCPHKIGHKGDTDSWLVCLPMLELFPRKTVTAPPLDEHTGKHTIWRKDVWIPYVGLVTLEIYGSGGLHGAMSAGLGPGTISNMCFDVDPHSGAYKARGELRIPAHFLASLTATATLGADAKWFLIVKVASAKGTLEAKAMLAGNATLVLSGQVAVSCRGGKPTLESDLDFPGCLELRFDLDAGFDIEALGFNVFSRKWNLISAKWDKCWGEDVGLKHTGKDPNIDLRDKRISLTDLLEFLLSDKAEKTEPTNQQRQVKESPLTITTAKTVPQLAPQLDKTNYGTGTVKLNSGATDRAGVDMMSQFLIGEEHGTPPSQQNNIYGFRKLPTLRAFGGKGHKQAQVYIKGHLLNENLGGPGEDKNLFPITGQANSDHKNQVEKDVKDLVLTQRLVAMYGVRVGSLDGPHDIDVLGDGTCTYEYLNADFDCTYGTYTLFTDNTVELRPITDKTIHSTFDLPGFISGVKAKNCPEK